MINQPYTRFDDSSFLKGNHRQFTNFTGVVSSFDAVRYNTGPGVMLGITLPCQLNIAFQFIEITNPAWGNLDPESQTPLSKWRTALENIVKGDSVTFSGRFAPNKGISFAVMTELRKKGGVAYEVPDEYILREKARREDELRKDKIIQGVASRLAGKWSGEWELGGIVNPLATNRATFSLDLIRNGSVITGTYYERGGSSNISGSVDGKQISFGYKYSDGSSRRFVGAISATGEVSGKWDQKNGSGTWKMVKKSFPAEPSNDSVTAQQQEVARAFLSYEARTHPGVAVTKAALVASQYALLEWVDANTGGQALLKYERSKGWSVLSTGGGAWGLPDLLHAGVPAPIAKKLCDLNKAADTSPNQEWRKNSPDAC